MRAVVEGKKNADLVGTTPTSSVTTYYAKWFSPTSEFWLSSTNTTGTQLSDFTGDTNYRSDKDIVEDMRVMHVGNTTTNATAYSEVTARWNTYYSNDVKLYATYTGGETEKTYVNTKSAVNGLVEFRIMEVSGEAGHLNTTDDTSSSDGSVVTFMATHVLPTAEKMQTSQTNAGGWDATTLRKKLNSDGDIYNKFPTALTSAIYPVEKLNNAAGGAAADAAGTTTTDAFWIISYSELYTTGTYNSSSPKNEGTSYQWCIDKSINGNTSNPVLVYTTRSGHTAGSSSSSDSCWWERSPRVANATSFRRLNKSGDPTYNAAANNLYGVVPAFCM